MSYGAVRLLAWLESRSRAELADDLAVDVSLIGHWACGRRRPSLDLAFALERISDGAVSAEDWVRK